MSTQRSHGVSYSFIETRPDLAHGRRVLAGTPCANCGGNIQAVEDYCAELGSLTERKCLQCGRPPVQRPHEEPVLEIKHMWERSGAGKR